MIAVDTIYTDAAARLGNGVPLGPDRIDGAGGQKGGSINQSMSGDS